MSPLRSCSAWSCRSSWACPVLAENTGQGDDGYGRSYAYCEGLEGPISALITAPEGQGEGLSQEEGASAPEAAAEKEFSFTTDYTGGQTVWAAIRYQAWGTQPTQEQWRRCTITWPRS